MADVLDDEEWDRAVEDVLEESAHDTELGKCMGRDAIRVSIGEMSEETFHEKYHEDIVDEFGVDYRPRSPVTRDE